MNKKIYQKYYIKKMIENSNLQNQTNHYFVPKELIECKNGENYIIGSNSGLYLIFYSWDINYSFDIIAFDNNGVRIISQNTSANISYWNIENNLYATNNTGYKLFNIGIFKVI